LLIISLSGVWLEAKNEEKKMKIKRNGKGRERKGKLFFSFES